MKQIYCKGRLKTGRTCDLKIGRIDADGRLFLDLIDQETEIIGRRFILICDNCGYRTDLAREVSVAKKAGFE